MLAANLWSKRGENCCLLNLQLCRLKHSLRAWLWQGVGGQHDSFKACEEEETEGFLFALFIFWINSFYINLKGLYITSSKVYDRGFLRKIKLSINRNPSFNLTLTLQTNSTNANIIASTKCRSTPSHGTLTASLKHHNSTEHSKRTELLKHRLRSGTWKIKAMLLALS